MPTGSRGTREYGGVENAGLPELRKEIVKKLKRDHHVDANASQIMVTVGAIEGFALDIQGIKNATTPRTNAILFPLSTHYHPPFSGINLRRR